MRRLAAFILLLSVASPGISRAAPPIVAGDSTVVVDTAAGLRAADVVGLRSYTTHGKIKTGAYYDLVPTTGSPDDGSTVLSAADGRQWTAVASASGVSGTFPSDSSHVAVCAISNGAVQSCSSQGITVAATSVTGLAGVATSGLGSDLGAGSVTNAQLANMAQSTLKCRTTPSTGPPQDCTVSQIKAILAFVSSDIGDATMIGRALLTAADAAGARTLLGLGSAALQASSAFDAAGAATTAAAAAQAASQPLDADLTALAALTTTTFGRALTTLVDAAALRAAAALGTMATQAASAVAITGGTITGMPTPSGSSDVATKGYADAGDTQACGGDLGGNEPACTVKQASGAFAFPGVLSPAQLTANTNDYTPTGFSAATVVLINSNAAVNLTGLVAGSSSAAFAFDTLVSKATIASATTLPIASGTGSFDTITGSTAITDYATSSSGQWRILYFTGAPLVSAGTHLVLLNSAGSRQFNIGDMQIVASDGGVWREVAYFPKGDSYLQASKNLSDVGSVATSRASLKLPSANVDADHPPIPSGRYQTVPNYASTTTHTAGANSIGFAPFYVGGPQTFTDCGWAVFTISAGSYKCGVYADNGSGKPTGTALATTAAVGPVTASSTFTAETGALTASVTLQPGWYWLGLLPDTSGSVVYVPDGMGAYFAGSTGMTSTAQGCFSRRLTAAVSRT